MYYLLTEYNEQYQMNMQLLDDDGVVTPLNEITGALTVLGSSYQKTSLLVAEP